MLPSTESWKAWDVNHRDTEKEEVSSSFFSVSLCLGGCKLKPSSIVIARRPLQQFRLAELAEIDLPAQLAFY